MFQKVSPRLLDSEPLERCCLDQCRAACCLHGVWIDTAQAQSYRDHADLIRPYLPIEHQDPQTWFDDRLDADEFTPSRQVVHSAVVKSSDHYGGTACVFLRADHKCALQVAAEAAGYHPWHFKPYYCILHPLDLDEEGRITLDKTELLLDEPGSCLRPAGQRHLLAEVFESELKFLLGDSFFQDLLREARK